MRDRGNILFLILLAVVLFAALSYAVTGSMRGDGKNASAEKAQLSAAQSQNYEASITSAITRLKMTNNCTDGQISYEHPIGINVNPDAPLDKSCNLFHPSGAGVPYIGDPPCTNLTTISIGQRADCGLIYAGTSGSKRLYVHASDDSGSIKWDGTGNGTTGATSASDGMANTNTILAAGSGFAAASLCRSFGPEWYMPSQNEVDTLRTYRNSGLLAGTYTETTYWTSRETSSSQAYGANMVGGGGAGAKTTNMRLRCVRSD